MRSPQYIEVIQRRVVPKLEKRYPSGSGIFQQDLALCHTSKIVKIFMTGKNIPILDWPRNSPDVSPIANMWAICKSRLCTADCTAGVEKLRPAGLMRPADHFLRTSYTQCTLLRKIKYGNVKTQKRLIKCHPFAKINSV